MAIFWGRCSGDGGDGKISNQDENTKTTKVFSHAEVAWVSLLCCPLAVPALFLSGDDEKMPLAAVCRRPSHAAPSHISTSAFPPLLADRTLEQRATSLPTWLSGKCLGSALSLQTPSWDIFSGTTGGCCYLGMPDALSEIKPKAPDISVLHL